MAAHGMMALRKPVIAVDKELKKALPIGSNNLGQRFLGLSES